MKARARGEVGQKDEGSKSVGRDKTCVLSASSLSLKENTVLLQ
jgi:hypothetical protein